MSRGESDKRSGKSRGVAIGISFALLCLAALTLVLRTTDFIEDFRSPWSYVPPAEPIVGVYAALRSVPGICASPASGPRMPGPAPVTSPERTMASFLLEQGFVELPATGETATLPTTLAADILEGGCGYALLVPTPGSTLAGLARLRTPNGDVALLPSCGAEEVSIVGTGSVELRLFALPGVASDAPARTRLSAAMLLRLALAEAALSRRGFIPWSQYVVEHVPAGAPTGYHRLSAPATPSHGCVAWVAVAEGFSGANSSFEGQPLGTSCEAWNAEATGFSLGLLSCDATGGGGASEVTFNDPDGGGGQVVFRPFGIAPAGPRTLEAPPVSTVASLREAGGGTITLPTPTPRREP